MVRSVTTYCLIQLCFDIHSTWWANCKVLEIYSDEQKLTEIPASRSSLLSVFTVKLLQQFFSLPLCPSQA